MTSKSKDQFCGRRSKPFIQFLRPFFRIYRLIFPNRFQKSISLPPKKILLCNWSALGDVVISTAAISLIKKAFPDCKIGFLVAAQSKKVIAGHPFIDWIHEVTNPLERLQFPTLKKLKLYFSSAKNALNEIEAIQYEVAIDLHPFFPNFICFLRKTNIPSRIGFDTGGFYELLSHAIEWRNKSAYLSEYYWDLLRPLQIEKHLHSFLKPILKSYPSQTSIKQAYIVLHVGSDAPSKEWDLEQWKKVSAFFSAQGLIVVFTGKGEKQNSLIEAIMRDIQNCINLCNHLDWHEFASMIQTCKLLISLDSVPVHLAGLYGVPCIAIFINQALETSQLWCPPSTNCTALVSINGSIDAGIVIERGRSLFTKNSVCLRKL